MSALTHWKKILLGSVASIAMLGAAVAPAASAATLPVTASPVPVLQGGAGGEHAISVRLLSVYVHDDGDGVGLGAGEWEEGYTFINISGSTGATGTLHLENGTGWEQIYSATNGVDRTEQYYSDKNYPMTQQIAGYNKFFGVAYPGTKLKLYSQIGEFDKVAIGQGSVANAYTTLAVPAAGAEKTVSFDVETGKGLGPHIRATFTVRIATAS
ncbi:hypothetical protein D1871_05960 [Nakamurella silvestris]|nr:hypothetical protein D1871_05960 [Nakamurella silvestris]